MMLHTLSDLSGGEGADAWLTDEAKKGFTNVFLRSIPYLSLSGIIRSEVYQELGDRAKPIETATHWGVTAQ